MAEENKTTLIKRFCFEVPLPEHRRDVAAAKLRVYEKGMVINMQQQEWLASLASAAPTPGGGGASALVGAVAAALGSMVANLTTGKKKYAAYQEDIERLLRETASLSETLYGLIQADADAFAPLAAAYGIPKEDPRRAETLEAALGIAAAPPMEMLRTLSRLPILLEELADKGSRLAVSDVGCAAAFCASALSGALLNLLVNTRLMQDRQRAEALNLEAEALEKDGLIRCSAVLEKVKEGLRT